MLPTAPDSHYIIRILHSIACAACAFKYLGIYTDGCCLRHIIVTEEIKLMQKSTWPIGPRLRD